MTVSMLSRPADEYMRISEAVETDNETSDTGYSR